MENIFLGKFNLYQIILLLFTYSFLGWCLEVIYATTKNGKFVNRGFLNGPLCPLYGVGAVVVLLCLQNFLDNVILLFFSSIILTSTLEFLTGLILEKLLHKKWWDYSNEPFNIKGYICLRFSIAWGFICVFVLKIINPAILSLISKINLTVGYVLICVFTVSIIIDFVFTILQITKICKDIKQIEKINESLKTSSNFIGSKLSSATSSVQESFKNVKTKVKNSRLGKAFPNLTLSYNEMRISYRTKQNIKKVEDIQNKIEKLDFEINDDEQNKIG
mgnify:FL=1